MRQHIEKIIHLNITCIGGFFGGFAILNHCDLFGSAQTSNLISIALMIAGQDKKDFLIRIIGMLLYLFGVAITVILPHKIKNINMKLFSVFVTMISIIIILYIPENTNHFVALYPIFFAMSVQWCCFKGAEGFTSSSIFSTNNFRQCVASFTEYFLTKDKEALRKGKFFGNVLLFFHIGVVFSYFSCKFFGKSGILFCLFLTASAFFFIYVENLSKEQKIRPIQTLAHQGQQQ